MKVEAGAIGEFSKPMSKNPDEVFAQFEGLFAREMVSQMKSMVGGEGLFGKGPGAGIYEGFFETAFSEILAENGSLGITDMMRRAYVNGAMGSQGESDGTRS